MRGEIGSQHHLANPEALEGDQPASRLSHPLWSANKVFLRIPAQTSLWWWF